MMMINDWTNWGRAHDKSREGGVLRSVGLSVLLFDDERPDVVPGFLVVFGVGSVAVRELQTVRTHNVRRKTKVALIMFTPFVQEG